MLMARSQRAEAVATTASTEIVPADGKTLPTSNASGGNDDDLVGDRSDPSGFGYVEWIEQIETEAKKKNLSAADAASNEVSKATRNMYGFYPPLPTVRGYAIHRPCHEVYCNAMSN